MSLWREVLITNIPLLQRKTLIETKNRTLKCLKRHYLTVWSMKNVAVLTEDGAFVLFFRPHPRGFDSSRVMPGVCRGGGGVWGCGGWVQLESGIEQCINTPKEKVSCCRMVSGSRYSSWSFRICKRVSRNRFLKLLYLRCLKCVAITFYALGPNFEKEDFCISNLES